MLEQKRL